MLGELRALQGSWLSPLVAYSLVVRSRRDRSAVAVNRDVVPRSAFPAQMLLAGDRVEILEAVGGG